MEREVRYCTTHDGVRIAYFVRGSGPPFVLLGTWAIDSRAWQPIYGRIAEFCTVIHFHPRGQGLSDRDVADVSLEARCLDLDAVLGSIARGPASIMNLDQFATMIAMAFAAKHPHRVERMSLNHAVTSMPREIVTRIDDLARAFPNDSRSVLETYVRSITGWELSDDDARQWVQDIEQSMGANQFAAAWRELSTWNVRSLIPAITAPTLLTYNQRAVGAIEDGREIASLLPHGRMVVFDEPSAAFQASLAFFVESETTETRTAITAAVGRPDSQNDGRRHSGTAVILFTDIADSTGLTERMGDTRFRAASRSLDSRVRTAMEDNGGTPVDGKVLGDGVMGVFPSAAQAIAAALRCAELSRSSELLLHIGLHAGDVLHEADNVYGGAVNIASRICGLCEPGEILVSQTVRDLARTSAAVTFEDRGEHALKGIAESQRLFAIRDA